MMFPCTLRAGILMLASGQINMRKVDGWQTFGPTLIDQQFDLVA
jgi:hypothetical protein